MPLLNSSTPELPGQLDLDLCFYPSRDGSGAEALDRYTTISAEVYGLNDAGRGIIASLDLYVPGYDPLIGQHINLTDTPQRDRTIDAIAQKYPDYLLYTPRLLDRVAQAALKAHSHVDEPTVHNINTEPATMDVEHLFCIEGDMRRRVLPKNQHTTMYAQGGSGKSLTGADYLPLLFATGIVPDGGVFFPLGQGNVLVCDWETNIETHRRYIKAIKAGINGLDLNAAHIHYIELHEPITKQAVFIQQYIKDNAIELLVIDSQMAAMAGAFGGKTISDAEAAGVYYNLLTSFDVTTLTIDHIPKSSMNSDNGTGAAFGSVVKYNRARAVFELKQASEPGENSIELAFVQTKNNLGPKLKPFGVRINFESDENGILELVTFESLDLATAGGDIAKLRGTRERVREYILDDKGGSPQTIRTIAAALELKEDTVKKTLQRNPEFLIVGGSAEGKLWGISV